MAASDHGLGSPREADRPESRDSKAPGQPTPPPTSSPSPHHRYSTPLPPDQNSNSVRDLENAMSKHLPREKEAGSASLGLIPGAPSLEASHLLKQIYSRPGYFPDLESAATVSADSSSQFLNYARLTAGTTGYPPASPAQPVPLKPNVYSPGTTSERSLSQIRNLFLFQNGPSRPFHGLETIPRNAMHHNGPNEPFNVPINNATSIPIKFSLPN